MIPDKYFTPTRLLLLVTFFVFSFSKIDAQGAGANAAGKAVFIAKCASCHTMGNDGATGPNLQGVVGRWGGDVSLVKQWIVNWSKLAKTNAHAAEVAASRPGVMQIFEGQITDPELDAVIDYADKWQPPVPTTAPGGQPEGEGRGGLIFGIISLIMALIALILMQVNSNLKKLSDDAEGILRPDPVPFYKNKVYIALFSIVLFIVGCYYTANDLIGF